MAETMQENQRIRITKRILRETMMVLLKEHDLDHISVKELCTAAQINRSTFYTHYRDVQHLYNEMSDQLVDDLMSCLRKAGPGVLPMLEYIQAHAEECQLLLYNRHFMDTTYPAQARIQNEILPMLFQVNHAPDTQAMRTALRFAFGGGNAILMHWVNHGCNMPANELAALLVRFSERVVTSID